MTVHAKPGSKPYRDQLRAELVRLGAGGQRLAELMARDLLLHGLRPRQAWRNAAELSQREAAERFNQVTANPRAPMTGNRIGDFEQWPDGGVRPVIGTLKTLASVYGTTWDQLIDTRDLSHMPEADRLDYLHTSSQPAAPPPARPAPAARKASRPLTQDELVTYIAEESQDLGEWAAMSEVADTVIAQYAAQARRLSRDFESAAPSLPILLETRRLRDRIADKLRGRHTTSQERNLYLVAAQTCGLLAWMTADLGNYRAADTHAWTAWMCAEQAAHDGARAWVRCTQSKLAYWDGRYTEAAQLAEDGLRYRVGQSAAMLCLFQARALGKAGRRTDAEAALSRAESQRPEATGAPEFHGIWHATPVRYHSIAANTRVLLAQPSLALAETAQTVVASQAGSPADRHPWSERHAQLDAALAHLQQRDLDGALTALRPVLELGPDDRNDPLTQHLSLISGALTHERYAETPLAAQAREEIETWQRDALPRQFTAVS